MSEVERIRIAYARRERDVPPGRYSYFSPGHLLWMQQLERDMLRLLRDHGLTDLARLDVLEVGCGSGEVLRRFMTYGCLPERLKGIDIRPDAIEEARRMHPNVDVRCGDAAELPFESEQFDLVVQVLAFSSMLDDGMRRRASAAMARVLRSGGHILWYDLYYNNPANPDVRGTGPAEIRALFPSFEATFRRVTLGAPVARALAPWSRGLCGLLERIPWLRSHYLALLTKAAPEP
ncbi:MAG: class I SAM-dependent methyltransferase [Candidatus Rokubacteria bacterium]|nr:class I SAM-dependent methyltransferase [Candidatus Rokubacteria bacterium]